jgi:hypothetical protein
MPIDSRIPLGFQRPKAPDQMQQIGNVLAIQGAQQQNALAQSQMDRNARAEARDTAMRSALASTGGDPAKVREALIGTGDVGALMTYDKGQADISKNKSAQQLSDLGIVSKKIEIGAQILGTAKDQASYERALQIAADRLGIDAIRGAPANFDPQWVESTMMQALTTKQRIDAQLNADQFGETRRHNRASESNAAANAASMNAYRQIRLDQADRANDIAAGANNFKSEQAMADDFRASSKDFGAVRDSYKRIKTALETANTSAPATLAAATSFMKLLDPGSVVRESELGMALEASGALDRASNYVNILKNGKVLTKQQVNDFRKISREVYKAAESAQLQREDEFKQQADRYGLDPRNIIGNGMSLPEPAAPAMPNAQQAPDGKFYIPDPQRPGKFLMVEP